MINECKSQMFAAGELERWGRALRAPNGETPCRLGSVGAERASNPHSTLQPLFTNKFAQASVGEFRHYV